MEARKALMLLAVLLMALGMASGAYTAKAAQITSTAIVLTQKTSTGGKLFFIIDVNKLRSSYPQAVAVNIFMDTDPLSQITSTSVPLIVAGGSSYNGIPVPYNEPLALDTSGTGENLLIVSVDLPRDNSWWKTVEEKTGINYANATDVRLKIQVDPNTVAVMDGAFSITNNTLVGTYTYKDTDLSYTAFDASWYGGPTTTNNATATIQLFHGDGTPVNLTNGDTPWINYQVIADNSHETYTLFTANLTTTGVSTLSTDMFQNVATTDNTSTSQVNVTLGLLDDFSATPTSTVNASGVVFPVSEFNQYFNVTLPPISDAHYPNNFTDTGGSTDYIVINVTSTNYLNLSLVDTNTVFAQGTLSANGITGDLEYYTYNATANAFGSYSVDYVFNQTHNKEYEIYIVLWKTEPPSIKVYPSIDILATDPTQTGYDAPLDAQMNPGDTFVVEGHNLPATANFSSICLAYWDGTSFQIWPIENTSVVNPVDSDGTIFVDAVITDHWYGGKTFYPIIRVNMSGTMYRTWFNATDSIEVDPYVKAYYLGSDVGFHSTNGALLAPGDYILIKGYGFITTEDLTAFIAYNLSDLSKNITLTNVQGMDANGDGVADILIAANEEEGRVALVVKIPADINMDLFTGSGFKFGLAGSGKNVGYSLQTPSNIEVSSSTEKVFVWKYDAARFKVNTTTLWVDPVGGDVSVYPYEAYEYIAGIKEDEVLVTVEAVGIEAYANASVVIYMMSTTTSDLINVTSFSPSELVQGYKELTIQVPSTYNDHYIVYLNESNDTDTLIEYAHYGVNVSCIVGYRVGDAGLFTELESNALIAANPGATVYFIGFGLDANADGNITSVLPPLPNALATFTTTANGELNTSLSTSDILQLTGRDYGMFQLKLATSPCSAQFTLMISEKPLFKIDVETDNNAFVGDMIYVAVKLKLVYATEEVPMLTQSQDVASLQYITLWFIYGPGDVDVVNITSLTAPNVVYVNKETSEVVISYTVDHEPLTDELVVDALAAAKIFGGYFTSTASDHAVISIDTTLSRKLIDIGNTATDAKSAAENAASAASQAASAASQAASAASDAANAASKAASDAAAAKSAAENAASKVDAASSTLSKSISDLSSKIDDVNNVAASAKTFSLANSILIIITLLVALFLVVRMRP